MRILFFFYFFLLPIGLSAQTNIREVLKTIPQQLFPYMTENNYLDMIDFADSGMEAIVTNSLGGKSCLEKLTDNSAHIQLNEASHIDVVLLDAEFITDSTKQVIGIVHTCGSDFKEIRIQFFTSAWTTLKTTPELLKSLNSKGYFVKKG